MLAVNNPQLTGPLHFRAIGAVLAVQGPLVQARLPYAALGDFCTIELRDGAEIEALVAAFSGEAAALTPLDHPNGISPGARVINHCAPPQILVSEDLLGCVLDAAGRVLEQQTAFQETPAQCQPTSSTLRFLAKQCFPCKSLDLFGCRTPRPAENSAIREPLWTGVRVIDALCTLGRGQRIGLCSGPGVGKSTLLEMIAHNTAADVCIIALIGERSREVGEFCRKLLGSSANARRCIIVSATSSESPARRKLALYTATTIAEFFRDQGRHVLLLADSLTRTARALREVGLAAGELPVRQGYPASVYAELPRLLERAGPRPSGSITAVYTVLTHADGASDALAEEIKSLLDGHLVLDPAVWDAGIRPALDPGASISRLLPALHDADRLRCIYTIQRVISRLKRDRDILLLGGKPDAELAAALDLEPALKEFLMQDPQERLDPKETLTNVQTLAAEYVQLVCARKRRAEGSGSK